MVLIAKLAFNVKHKLIANRQRDLAIGKFADPDLGPLQVCQDSNVEPMLLSGCAHLRRTITMILGSAMRKIKPNNIDTGQDQLLDHLGGRSCRPKGRNDFGGAGQAHDYFADIRATVVSSIRLENPHSLSYHDKILTSLPSGETRVWVESKMLERGSWLKSIETKGSAL